MKSLFVLAASLVVLAGPASAQLPGPGEGRSFGLLEFDSNADGKVAKAEFEAGQRARFNQLDANRDGAATPEEIAAGREAQAKAAHEAARKERFAELDKDKNGQISQAEFLAASDDRGDRREPRMRLDAGPPGPGLPGPPPRLRGLRLPDGPGRGAPIGAGLGAGPADTDRDGKLTFAEFSARGNEAFARADTNKDGTVTIAELQARAGAR